MTTAFQDLTGKRFGRLVVLRRYKDKTRSTKWTCQCDCGRVTTTYAQTLKRGETKSCGCLFREETSKRQKGKQYGLTHGMSRAPEYRIWAAMLERCQNPKATGYNRYGGRGIKVCDRWTRFDNFIADMGKRPGDQYSIERKDNDGNYEASNCYWATREEQLYNKSNTILIDYKGSKITTLQASKLAGISAFRIRQRMFQGWSVEDAINRPQRLKINNPQT